MADKTEAYRRVTESMAQAMARIPCGTLARHPAPRAATVVEGIGADGETFVARVPLEEFCSRRAVREDF